MSVGFYCLSYKNRGREHIEKVFAKFGIEATISSGVDHSDPRLREAHEKDKRAWSMTYGHLDEMRVFCESDHAYGIFCDDDIIIRKDFMELLPNIVNDFNNLSLDIMMLGYLCENKIDGYSNFPTLLNNGKYKCLAYPDDLWGTQMYLISKTYAKRLIEQYYYGYAERTLRDSSLAPFSPDWTITKLGRRALVYPLMAIENFHRNYNHPGQMRSHTNCYLFSYRPELFD